MLCKKVDANVVDMLLAGGRGRLAPSYLCAVFCQVSTLIVRDVWQVVHVLLKLSLLGGGREGGRCYKL